MTTREAHSGGASGDDLQAAATFLQTLFGPEDLILIRPIETWSDGGRKQSRVAYRRTAYSRVTAGLDGTLRFLFETAEEERLNLFYGVCPRLGPKGRFDLAWQIRTVRALWADIDHASVEEVEVRVRAADLPEPSIIVDSGNGAHLYWLLDRAVLIEAEAPPPVETEWETRPDGRKKPRKYVLQDGERIYLEGRRHAFRLCPHAQQLQDILSGIAQCLGGDHTTDLSRLLRIAGSRNRKNQRNGATPKPTLLVRCEPDRRYPLERFQPLASPSPDAERLRRIETMPLPRPRRKSVRNAERLDQFIAACRLAPAGLRSEADFAMCCHAVRQGLTADELWSQVQEIGKFAEQGRPYFEHTWQNAVFEVQAQTYEQIEMRVAGIAERPRSPQAGPPPGADESADGGGPEAPDEALTIRVDPQSTPVAHTLRQITEVLLGSGGCFDRADQLVSVAENSISPILAATELAGLCNQYVEFVFVDDRGGSYKPLPATYGNTWLTHPSERSRLPRISLYSRNPVYTTDWRLVAPGYDKPSGIYYAGPVASRRTGTEHLDRLLNDFCFQTVSDRTNYLGMLLTIVLIARFIGSKPAVLFNGNQPGLGKSILAQIISILRDGVPAETATYNANDEEFEKRLGAIVHRGGTTIIIDNAKTKQGRAPRIDSPALERSITDPILSFRLLGHSASIRAENSHIVCITANSPDVSRDLITRCTIVNLFHEGNPNRRRFSIESPEDFALQHRLELLGELIGMVETWKEAGLPEVDVPSRFNKRGWGRIVGGILAANQHEGFLANVEQAASELDDTRREFSALVGVLASHPQPSWTAAELVDICVQHGLLERELGDGSPHSQAIRIGRLAGAYVAECFPLADQHSARFQRGTGRKGATYYLEITGSAEC